MEKRWMTKTGMILLAIGGTLQQLPEFFPFQQAVASVLVTVGAALGGIGIGRKLDRVVDLRK